MSKKILIALLLCFINLPVIADDALNIDLLYLVADLHTTIDDIEKKLQEGGSINAKYEHDSTLLHHAVARNPNIEITEFIINEGEDIHAKDAAGMTPLHTAIMTGANIEIIKLLIDKGSNIHEKVKNGITPLHLSTRPKLNPEIVRLLISSGANVYDKDSNGLTPLHYAIRWNSNIELIRTMVNKSKNINIQDNRGATALHWAMLSKSPEKIIPILLKAGSDIEIKAQDGSTPLHSAIELTKDSNVIEMLVSHGADVNSKKNSGMTPLHLALKLNLQPELINTLIQAGADIHTLNNDHLTPFEIAVQSKSSSIVLDMLTQAEKVSNIKTNITSSLESKLLNQSEENVTISPKQLFKIYSPSVVKLVSENLLGEQFIGSGFIIKWSWFKDNNLADSNYLLITNYHVAKHLDKRNTSIEFGYDSIRYPFSYFKMILSNEENDLAVLSDLSFATPENSTKGVLGKDFIKMSPEAKDNFLLQLKQNTASRDQHLSKLPEVTISDIVPDIGDKAYVIGSPIGLKNSFTEGIVSGYRKLSKDSNLLQISAPISSGSSGSPVFNQNGNVIGIVKSSIVDNNSQNLNFAILSLDLLKLLNKTKRQDDLLLKSATNGNSDDMTSLGDIYYDRHQYESAQFWYTEAASLNNYKGMYKLGNLLLNQLADTDDALQNIISNKEITVSQKLKQKQALELMTKAADSGCIESLLALSDCYLYARSAFSDLLGITQIDKEKAINYLTVASDLGSAEAMYRIGMYYGANSKELDEDFSKCISWLKKAADLNYAEALLEYDMLQYIGGAKDSGKYFLYKASKLQSTNANLELGKILYSEGYYNIAYELYLEVIRGKLKGFKEALYLAGNMTENGEGTDKDIDRALFLYKTASRLGYKPADDMVIKLTAISE